MKNIFFSIFNHEFHNFKRALANFFPPKINFVFFMYNFEKKLQLEKKFRHLYMKNLFFSIFSNEFQNFKRALANFFPPKFFFFFSCTILKKSYNSKINFATYTWNIFFFSFLATNFTIWSELSQQKKNHENKLVHHEIFWSSLIQEKLMNYLTSTLIRSIVSQGYPLLNASRNHHLYTFQA